jgi:hypothetical protein
MLQGSILECNMLEVNKFPEEGSLQSLAPARALPERKKLLPIGTQAFEALVGREMNKPPLLLSESVSGQTLVFVGVLLLAIKTIHYNLYYGRYYQCSEVAVPLTLHSVILPTRHTLRPRRHRPSRRYRERSFFPVRHHRASHLLRRPDVSA